MKEVIFTFDDGSEYTCRNHPDGDSASTGLGMKLLNLVVNASQSSEPIGDIYERAAFVAIQAKTILDHHLETL